MSASVDDRRPAQLVAALAAVRTRLANAAAAAQRDPWSVTLIAVTKTFPAADVAVLLGLGIVDIAESRDQEARAKLVQLRASDRLDPRTGKPMYEPRVHFVGRLQSNKCRSISRYADCVHTVDRTSVATALADGAQAAGREPLPVFIQVSLDGDSARGGIPETGLAPLADHVGSDARLRLLGLMAVAPLAEPPEQAYAKLAALSAALRADHPAAVNISAGMSADFEVAIKYGATHVRIGSALLGRRDPTFG